MIFHNPLDCTLLDKNSPKQKNVGSCVIPLTLPWAPQLHTLITHPHTHTHTALKFLRGEVISPNLTHNQYGKIFPLSHVFVTSYQILNSLSPYSILNSKYSQSLQVLFIWFYFVVLISVIP